jgi:hypothetical protein
MNSHHLFFRKSILILIPISIFCLVTCNKESEEELCGLLTCDSNNKPWINNNCSPESSGSTSYSTNILEYDRIGRAISYSITTDNSNYEIKNMTFDQFSRPVSYSFIIKCKRGFKEYTGEVNNVLYDGIGQATSYNATINNTTCRYVR